jgi:hypothetical protein
VTSLIPLAINLPAGVELADASAHVGVSIAIKGIETKEFLFASNEVLIEGLAEGYKAYVTDGDITVSVSGTESVMATLAKEDIIPYVDLTGLDPFVLGPESPLAPQPVQLRYEKALRKAEVRPEFLNLNIVENRPSEEQPEERMPTEQTPGAAETGTGGDAAGEDASVRTGGQ